MTAFQPYPRLDEATAEQLDNFSSFGETVDPKDVPAMVRAGREVWSFGYGWDDDEDFTTINESDLWAFAETLPGDSSSVQGAGDADVVASWGPFRVTPEATR